MNETKVSPSDHVFAVLPSRNSATAAIEELGRAGFHEASIFEGNDVTEAVDPKGENAGRFAKLIKMIGDHLSEEPNYLSQYQEEAKNGSTVLAVLVKDRDEAERAKDVLEKHSGRNIRYFGKLAVADLTPASNPSTRSEESPESEKWSKQ